MEGMKDQLIRRLEESLEDGYHGPSMYKLIQGLPIDEASARPLSKRHSIWEIVNHTAFWMTICEKVLEGMEHPAPGELDDWPKRGSTKQEWEESVSQLGKAADALKKSIKDYDGDFTEITPPSDFSYEWMLNGVCNHNLYHTGQVILLRASNP
ncbi:MAG: DinB family protein [Candidatus Bathyarchaeota archaeon]|nr:DinB family protein [Candidatus Bathyarchaeota archaeon]